MARYLFSSHDGFGLGHVRRNTVIASAVLAAEADASVGIVTGLAADLPWQADPRISIVRVPPLVKDSSRGYLSSGMSFEAALAERAVRFAETVDQFNPDVIVVDRHPYGTAGELRPGLERARRRGARLVLGLRDILDDAVTVRMELAGEGWRDAEDMFDRALVYGARHFCDHGSEYGMPLPATYCGWVVEKAPSSKRVGRLLAVSAGGGGDGADVFALGVAIAERQTAWTVELAAGPYADTAQLDELAAGSSACARIKVRKNQDACGALFAQAEAILEMAGCNSTVEALAAGRRPILVPRRHPRQEQLIRAERLEALGLAQLVDAGADAASVGALLDRPHDLGRRRLARAGISLDGAAQAALAIRELAWVSR